MSNYLFKDKKKVLKFFNFEFYFRGAAPRSEDYNFDFAFPHQRLMNQQSNMNKVPSYSPQVF